MNSYWKLPLIALPVLLTACAGMGSYRQQRTTYADSQETQYYVHETRLAGHTVAPTETAQPDTFLDDVQTNLLATKKRWEQKLAEPQSSRGAASADSGQETYAHYRELAQSPELEATLANQLDLELLLGLVPELNPGVKAAQRNLRATLERYPQAAYLDNILRQYNAFTKQLDTRIGPQPHKQMMAMQFPFPDTLALKGKIVSEEVEIAERQREIALRDALTAVREAYDKLLFTHDAITINRQNQQLLEQMIEVAQSKIRSGAHNYTAVIMAQVELSKLEDSIITLEEQQETLAARINTLLSRPADAPLGKPQPVKDQDLQPSLDELYAIALEERQELQQQRLRINRMNTMVELATTMANPDPSMGYSYFEDGARLSSGTDQEAPAFMTERRLDNRRMPWFGQRDAYIHEVEVKVEALDHLLREMEDETRFMVKQAHFSLNTAKRSITLYRHSLLPQAEQSLEAASTSYRAGSTDFLTFLDAQRTLLTFRLEEQRALRDFRLSQARLDQLAGGRLPRQPISLPQPPQRNDTE